MKQPSRQVWVWAALVVLIFAVYGQVAHFGYTNYDDPDYVIDNPHVASGITLDSLKWAMTSGYKSNWLPLTWISYMLELRIFGRNSGLQHLTNVLLHALSSILLFVVLLRMTGAFWRTAFVAGVFALHPLRVESVAWIAERKDVLSTLFWMLTMWCYFRYVQRPGIARYLSTIITFVLGLMAKPMLVTVPFSLLLLDVWPLQRINRKNVWSRIAEKSPMLALSVAVSVINYFIQQQAGSVMSLNTVPFSLRLENALVSYAMYLWKMVWPIGLAPIYPIPMSIVLWQPIVAGIVLGAISVVVFWQGWVHPYLAVGWLWYLGTLVPVLGLVLVGSQARADRYTYVPTIGILILVVWGISDLARDRLHAPTLLGIGAVAALSACVVMSAIQVSYWRDSIRLFRHTIAVSENNSLAYNNLGVALFRRGDIDESMECFKKAMSIPHYFDLEDPYINMGAALLSKDRPSEALPYLSQAIEYMPQSAKAHTNLGVALDDLDQTSEALNEFRKAIQIEPENAEAQAAIGVTLAKVGAGDEALAHVREALRVRPAFAGFYFDLGQIYGFLQRPADSEQAFQESIQLDPSKPQAYFNLGLALGLQGKLREASIALRTAIRLKPNYPTAWFNLGSVLAQNDRLDEAVAAYSEALRLQPNLAEARAALAGVQALRRRP